jgi:N-acetylmuramate 1-kinase
LVEKVNVELLLVRKLVEDYLKSRVLEIHELTGDASSRKYYRFSHAQKSFVACLGAPFEKEDDSDFLKVQKLLDLNNINVPKIYSIKPAEGFFIEEDLGDSTLVSYLGSETDDKTIVGCYQKVIDILIKMQSINVAGSVVETRSFDEKKFNEESALSIKYFLKSYLGGSQGDIDDTKFLAEIQKLNKALASESGKVLSHRDLHSRNIMVCDGDYNLIDFQDARMGLPYYDLVSLLEDCYFPLSSKKRSHLIDYYRKNSPLMEKVSQENFNKFYEMSAIQRIFKALGSFSFINETRKDDRYLKYVGVGVHRLLEILSSHSDFNNFYKILKRSYHDN